MSSDFGSAVRIQIFGQSHSVGIGVVIDGLPSGEAINTDEINRFLLRRQGGGELVTPRRETDIPKILSGIKNSATCGAPLCAIFDNTNTNSAAYSEFEDIPRPSHADFTAQQRYNNPDLSGGGHFSGRLTLPLCFAGAVALQILHRRGICIGAHIYSIGEYCDTPFNPENLTKAQLQTAAKNDFPVCSNPSAVIMKQHIKTAMLNGDSVGGIIECGATGLAPGIGEPIFSGVEGTIAKIIFGIPAVRGIEFGAGFAATKMTGSTHNDPYTLNGSLPYPKTNNAGGVIGGITTGAPLIFRIAFKPTPSIAMSQDTLNIKTGKDTKLKITGRHDPCIAVRAVPVVEAATAVALLDLLLLRKQDND